MHHACVVSFLPKGDIFPQSPFFRGALQTCVLYPLGKVSGLGIFAISLQYTYHLFPPPSSLASASHPLVRSIFFFFTTFFHRCLFHARAWRLVSWDLLSPWPPLQPQRADLSPVTIAVVICSTRLLSALPRAELQTFDLRSV